MYDLPPKIDKTVIIRKANISEEVRLSNELWRQMEFQMQLTEFSLEQFVTYALELYIDELLKRETNEKKWINFSEGQFNTHSQPIDIVHKSDDEDIFEDVQ